MKRHNYKVFFFFKKKTHAYNSEFSLLCQNTINEWLIKKESGKYKIKALVVDVVIADNTSPGLQTAAFSSIFI